MSFLAGMRTMRRSGIPSGAGVRDGEDYAVLSTMVAESGHRSNRENSGVEPYSTLGILAAVQSLRWHRGDDGVDYFFNTHFSYRLLSLPVGSYRALSCR